jgi:uncharacterized protein (DUF433 family)
MGTNEARETRLHQRSAIEADRSASWMRAACRGLPWAYNNDAMNDRITIDPAILGGKPIIRGTRMSVDFVVGLLARGWSVNDVLKEYDHLVREDIQACLAYAHQLLIDEKLYPVPA